jgi:hypothetical protein
MGLSVRQNRWREVARSNPRGFIERKIRIPNLMGQIVDFKYNWAQEQVSEKKKELHKLGIPVRLWVLKYRRAGISMEETAENYAYAYGTDNARVGIIAHLEDRAKELLDNNIRKFDECLQLQDPELWLPKARDNLFGMKFGPTQGQILLATAENPIKIRGDGLHRVQITEGAHFYNLFNNVMKEIGPVVPVARGSQVVIETTGSLIGSAPYEHWQEADLGKNEYITMFLNWLHNPAMAKPFTSDKQKHEIYGRISELEPRLAELNNFYKLTPEQIHLSWDMFHYQSKNDFDYFCREFPYSKEMAWSAGGDSYFGVYEISKAKPETPIAMYVIDQNYIAHIFKDPSELRRVESLDDYTILPQLKIWALPRKGARYVIGQDSSLGDAGGDFTSGYVIDTYTREMMASYHGLLRPDEAAHVLVSLARMYNNALAAPETNPAGGGYEALNCIQRLSYHNIYTWRRRDGNQGIEASRALGWWTHARSRPLMLGELRKMFQDCAKGRLPDPGMFRDVALINEMRTFGMRPDGTPGANSNCHDDRVMAISIAHMVANDETYCTDKDKLLQYSRSTMPKPPVDSEQLIKKDPNQVVDQFFNPKSNFSRNKFEI